MVTAVKEAGWYIGCSWGIMMEWRKGGGSAAALRGMSGVSAAGVEVGVMWLAATASVGVTGASTGVNGGVEGERVAGEGGGVGIAGKS